MSKHSKLQKKSRFLERSRFLPDAKQKMVARASGPRHPCGRCADHYRQRHLSTRFSEAGSETPGLLGDVDV
jgi:predicted PP-loop superfamily ATPase